MLQEYLNANLLSLINDEDFKKLKKSADEIAKKLVKSKAKIVSFTLSAIDPDITAENLDIIEVKEIIIKNWSTFSSNAKDTPLTYIRAVMFEALKGVTDDTNHSLLIWLASRNIVQYKKLIGEEKKIILEFLSQLGNEINQKANREWTLSANETFSKSNFQLKEVLAYAINKENLQKYLEDASGPHNEQGKPNFDSSNPHWSNSAPDWSYKFAPKAATGIKNAIDPSLRAIVTVVNENKNIIEENINKAIDNIQKETSDKNRSLQLRSELLWWKEAAYSSSTDKSYNDLDKRILEIVLAYDYSNFIPTVYPKSVDYFLKETHKSLKESKDEKLALEDIFKAIQKCSDELKLILPESDILTTKITLLNFINGLTNNKYKLNEFESLVGIQSDIKLSNSELIIWLFHDFQLNKIINTK